MNLWVHSYSVGNDFKVNKVILEEANGSTYTLENGSTEQVKFLCWKYVDSSENIYILFTKSTDEIPTSAYVSTNANSTLDEVAITYEQSTPAVLYNGNLYTRYLSGDIVF